MSNGTKDFPKVPEPQDGEVMSKEYVQQEASQGRLICVGFDVVQVAQVMALEMLKQGQMTNEAFENVKGSHLYLRKGEQSERTELVIVFYGRDKFSADGFKPSN